MKNLYALSLTLALIISVSLAIAEIPHLLTYQGYLMDSEEIPIDGQVDLSFSLYNSLTDGDLLWTESHSEVEVSAGVFSVVLGTINPIPDSAFSASECYLGITVGEDPEITPRTRITVQGYSFRVGTVEGASGGTIEDSLNVNGTIQILSGGLKFPDGTIQYTQAGASNGLPEAGGTMTGPIASVGEPPITMGKGNFGSNNTNSGLNSFVAGGNNTASGDHCTVGGGANNVASGINTETDESSINSKSGRQASGTCATVAGGCSNEASGENSAIGGGYRNSATGSSSAISGGWDNLASSSGSSVVGGYNNEASGAISAVVGGQENVASGFSSFVGGGEGNIASEYGSAVSGGFVNMTSGLASAVGGGQLNYARGDFSVISGGGGSAIDSNSAIGIGSAIPGGRRNVAGGDFSLAAGFWAVVQEGHHGTFIWADSSDLGPFESSGQDQFLIRASGGVGIGTNSPQEALDVAGIIRSSSGGFKFPDGTIQTTAVSGTGSGWIDDGANVRLETGSDNVGVGTDSPSEKLDVDGNIHASGYIRSGNSITISGTADQITASSGIIDFDDENLTTDGSITMSAFEMPTGATTGAVLTSDINGIGTWQILNASGWVDDGSAVRLETSGDNVGIGTSSPSEKLDVDGNIHASGSIISGNSITINGTSDQITASSGTIDFNDENLATTGSIKMSGFEMPNGAGSGAVLTSDANGVGSWQAVSGSGNTLNEAYNEGGSGAGRYIIADAGAVSIGGPDGLSVVNNNPSSSGVAFTAGTSNNGLAAYVTNYSSSNVWPAMLVETYGTGNVCEIRSIQNAASSGLPLYVHTNGTGQVAQFNTDNASNTQATVNINNEGTGPALWSIATGGGLAGQFSGDVGISSGDLDVNGDADFTGTVSKGAGSFKIDHPLDPANKFLYHSFVESPDMKNVYDGTAILDKDGRAPVMLPVYFESLNRDFRYQLTPIGAPGPNLYIAEEIADNKFMIAGGEPGMKVSWQVTGVRHDAFAEANRIQVEVDKPADQRGEYLHPVAFGLGEEMGVANESTKAGR